MATHSRKADPAACKLCARLMKRDGLKCRHHGGPGRSTSNRGKGPKKDQRPPPNGHNPALTLIDAEITKMDARLADLHRARGIVAALGLK